MIEPHGGTLVDLLARSEKRDALVERAGGLQAVDLSARQAADLELLAVGGFSPLRGFQGADDWKRVVHEMRLSDGLPWSIPITLATGVDAADGDELALNGPDGRLLGVLTVEETFERDLEDEARHVYRTTDSAHPGVAALMAEGTRCVAGPVRAVDLPRAPGRVRALHPAAGGLSRRLRGAGLEDDRRLPDPQSDPPGARVHHQGRAGVGRRPLHPPLVGETKSDDIPADVWRGPGCARRLGSQLAAGPRLRQRHLAGPGRRGQVRRPAPPQQPRRLRGWRHCRPTSRASGSKASIGTTTATWTCWRKRRREASSSCRQRGRERAPVAQAGASGHRPAAAADLQQLRHRHGGPGGSCPGIGSPSSSPIRR